MRFWEALERLYTAWDNIGDESVFFNGVDKLEKAGIPPKHLMAYMLIGNDILETWERMHLDSVQKDG